MRSARLAWILVIVLAARVEATQSIVLELEPEQVGMRAALDLHAWLRSSERVSGAKLTLQFDPSKVEEVRVRVPDALKSPDLVAQAVMTSSGADITVRYAPSGSPSPPVDTRSEIFTIHLCIKLPTPTAGWDFPAAVESCEVSLYGSESAVAVPVALDTIHVGWGADPGPGGSSPCRGEPEPPEFFTCVTQTGGQVLLTWRNPQPYDRITIHHGRNGQVNLPGDATSWVHEEGGASTNYVYTIYGYLSAGEGQIGHWSEEVGCAAEDPRPQVSFLRGDANADGALSTADILAIERWLFGGDEPPSCVDTADVNDDGHVTITDESAIANHLFDIRPGATGGYPPAPFPEPGPDPTHLGEASYMSCDAYEVTPPVQTSDAIRIGDVEAGSGGEVLVPIYLTNEVAVDALQLVVKYDPSVLRIATGGDTLEYEGTHYGQFAGQSFTVGPANFTWFAPYVSRVVSYPEEGIFTASIVSCFVFAEVFQVPPGEDTLVAQIRVQVSPDVPAGTALHLDPDAGPDGYGPFHIRNELTYRGEGRYATIHPREVGGILRIGVDGDISFFRRGDANGDEKLDISDAVSVLGYLFLGTEVSCEDAADADDSGDLLITDGIVLLMHLFSGTETIPAPYPEPGLDPNPDFLGGCRATD
jgi:hypothetical protein